MKVHTACGQKVRDEGAIGMIRMPQAAEGKLWHLPIMQDSSDLQKLLSGIKGPCTVALASWCQILMTR